MVVDRRPFFMYERAERPFSTCRPSPFRGPGAGCGSVWSRLTLTMTPWSHYLRWFLTIRGKHSVITIIHTFKWYIAIPLMGKPWVFLPSLDSARSPVHGDNTWRQIGWKLNGFNGEHMTVKYTWLDVAQHRPTPLLHLVDPGDEKGIATTPAT